MRHNHTYSPDTSPPKDSVVSPIKKTLLHLKGLLSKIVGGTYFSIRIGGTCLSLVLTFPLFGSTRLPLFGI